MVTLLILFTNSDSKMFQRPISGPGLVRNNSNSGTNVMAPTCNGFVYETQTKEPEAKRVKLFNFWARKRIIQRGFVLFMLGWISAFIYQAGLIEIVLKSAQHDPFLGPHVQLPEDQHQVESNDTKNKGENEPKHGGSKMDEKQETLEQNDKCWGMIGLDNGEMVIQKRQGNSKT